jgi:hypothetical protein
MTTGLPVSRLINVSVTLSPAAAQFANQQTGLIIGSTPVIDVGQRYRTYASAAAVATDLGNTTPEYLAAVNWFAQTPSPTSVFVGRWAQAATNGLLVGGALSAAQQALANFTAIVAGSLKFAIDGAGPVTITGLNFSGAASLSAVAALITAGLTGATCSWDGAHFIFKSATTGATSSIGFMTAPGSGVDISTVVRGTALLGARVVGGSVPESALTALQILDAFPGLYFYACGYASLSIVDADIIAAAAYIEGDTVLGPHLFGYTTQASTVPDSTQTTDIASVLAAAGYKRTVGQYCSTDPYAIWSYLAKAVSVNYLGASTTLNMQYQQEPGITPESLTLAQANALDAKRINYSAFYANGVAVLQGGVQAGAAYTDEITGTDWLANYIQTNLFNLLAQAGTKVPQTDAGMNLLLNSIDSSMAQSVANGLVAPGVWAAGGFGQLVTGQFLAKGYYIYGPPIATQNTTDRANRKSVPFQVAAKLAGAVDSANVIISVNR